MSRRHNSITRSARSWGRAEARIRQARAQPAAVTIRYRCPVCGGEHTRLEHAAPGCHGLTGTELQALRSSALDELRQRRRATARRTITRGRDPGARRRRRPLDQRLVRPEFVLDAPTHQRRRRGARRRRRPTVRHHIERDSFTQAPASPRPRVCSSSYSLRSIASNRAPSPSSGICKTVLVTYSDCDKRASLARATITSRSAGETRSDSITVFSVLTNLLPIRRQNRCQHNVMQSAKTGTRHFPAASGKLQHSLARARRAGGTRRYRAGQAARFRRLASAA